MRRIHAVATAGVVAAAFFTRGAAADPRPSWECLPEGTAVMVRVPRPTAFVETLRNRTKFGAVACSEERLRKARELAVEAWGSPAQSGSEPTLEDRLASYGLEPGDVTAAFTGDMGWGIVVRPRAEGPAPLVMSLAWLEPGIEAAERMVTAFHRLLAEEADTEHPPQRIDLELAGHAVTWAAQPILQADLGDVKVEGGLDAPSVEALQADLAERAKRAPKVVVGTVHAFLARIGGRVLVGQTMPQRPAGRRAGEPRGGRAESDAATDAAAFDAARVRDGDEARGVFERYLAAHGATDASPLADVLRSPAMRDALPEGDPLLEAVVVPSCLLDADVLGDPNAERRLAAIGLADLGPAALRIAFDEGRLRQGVFVTLPAPRAGLARILDQDRDPPEVPSCVTAEAIDFTQISLDLAQAYRTVKEFAVAEMGDQATNLFATAEAQAQAWLGVELERMLANLGSRHWIITYPPRIAVALEEARRNRDAGAARPSADRVAFVWKLGDDAPVLAVLPKVAALARGEVVEEQGFQGVRLPGGAAAIFAGQGHLVVGMGGDALEKTLAGIRNPPAGAASLREGDIPRKAAELLPIVPGRMFSVGDHTRTGGMLGELRDLVAAMVPDDVEDDYRELLVKAQAILPGADEMHGMFGVGASVMEVNDAGIAIESAWEMPAP